MEKFLEGLLNIVTTVNNYLSDYILVVLLLGIGIFYTIKTKFAQVRYFGQGMRNVFGNLKFNGGAHKNGMSSFQAFTTAVAAQVGTGNIVGASGAILVGGPGAIFWMWLIAFFGMSTVYAEAVLAQKTRVVNSDGTVSGGPVYYIRKAFQGKFGKFLAGFFAVAIIVALGFIGSMVQANSISIAVTDVAKAIPMWVIGIILSILCILVFTGGAKRIASVTEKIVPVMAMIYIFGGIIIVLCRITVLPEAIGMIFKYAFIPDAIIGGGLGYALKTAISMGAKRGLFSNEAGMGSTPHAHAQAIVKTPHEQGTVAIIGVFIDTFVVLTITALIIITTLYAGNGDIMRISQSVAPGGNIVKALNEAGYNGNSMIRLAVGSLFSSKDVGNMVGSIFVAVCLMFFAFSTIISWNLFGEINFKYLFGKKSVIIYTIISTAFIFLGSVLYSDLVWAFADFFNYLMVIPNVIALIALSKMVADEVKTNGKKCKKNKDKEDNKEDADKNANNDNENDHKESIIEEEQQKELKENDIDSSQAKT